LIGTTIIGLLDSVFHYIFESQVQFCKVPRSRIEIQEFLGLKHRRSFKENVLQPLLESGMLIQTIPDKPSSPKQRYITRNERKGNE